MSDAELLRRAARRIRETAQAATPGPWEMKPRTERPIATEVRHTGTAGTVARMASPDETAEDDAAHIALWHPGVAMAVHHWLADEAHDAAEDDDVAHPYALSLARRLLNEETNPND